jgi:putative colanic acid biosynthesis glycosyltransferase
MNSIPVFSIITAVKNRLNDLKQTYNSLSHQTNHNFEWVLVDGVSTDGTSEWLRGLSSNSYGIVLISEIDKGISDACNKGL